MSAHCVLPLMQPIQPCNRMCTALCRCPGTWDVYLSGLRHRVVKLAVLHGCSVRQRGGVSGGDLPAAAAGGVGGGAGTLRPGPHSGARARAARESRSSAGGSSECGARTCRTGALDARHWLQCSKLLLPRGTAFSCTLRICHPPPWGILLIRTAMPDGRLAAGT